MKKTSYNPEDPKVKQYFDPVDIFEKDLQLLEEIEEEIRIAVEKQPFHREEVLRLENDLKEAVEWFYHKYPVQE